MWCDASGWDDWLTAAGWKVDVRDGLRWGGWMLN